MTADPFWSDLQDEIQSDPEYARIHLLDWVRITTVDKIINELDARRDSLKMNKAALARAIHRDPAAIRRLLSDSAGNPTLETVSAVAAALGMKLELVPMEEDELATVSRPLQELATA